MIAQRKADIITLIQIHGPMGVNALQRELGVPLSSLQKYLHNQNYFRKNEDKKWDLPENVAGELKGNSLTLMAEMVETTYKLLRSQVNEMSHALENAINPITSLKNNINAVVVPVAADKVGQSILDPRLRRINETKDTLSNIFHKQKDNIPKEYRNLFFNFDYVGLVIKEGETYTNKFLEEGTYELLAGKDTELSEETIIILKENQLGKSDEDTQEVEEG